MVELSNPDHKFARPGSAEDFYGVPHWLETKRRSGRKPHLSLVQSKPQIRQPRLADFLPLTPPKKKGDPSEGSPVRNQSALSASIAARLNVLRATVARVFTCRAAVLTSR